MSAPLVVNTKDGMCWTRRTVTSSGIALYAPEGVCSCPEFVMATLAELAEHGIAGSADVLPVPVGPEPQPLSDTRLAEIRNRKLDEVAAGPWLVADDHDGRAVVYVERPMDDGRVGARVLLVAERASEADVQFVASARRLVPELVDEVVQLRARLAALESAAYGDAEVRLLSPVEQIRHLNDCVAAQMSRADTLDRLCREQRARADAAAARVAELESKLRQANTLRGDAAQLVERERGHGEECVDIADLEGALMLGPEDAAPSQGLREDDPNGLHHTYRMGRDLPELGGVRDV